MKNSWRLLGAIALFPAAIWSATISGVVSSGGGAGGGTPVSGAKVVLIAAGGAGGGQRLDSATTNAQGQYTLTDTAQGFRTLQASKAGYQNANGVVNVANDTAHYTVNLNMTPTPAPGKIAGTVTHRVTSAAIVGAQVVLARVGGGGFFLPETLLTNAQGQYSFDSVPANTGYALAVTATGFQAGAQNAIAVTAGQTTTVNVSLVPNGVTAGRIIGTVTNSTNQQPIANAKVRITRPGGGGAFPPDSVMTNAQGGYAFDSVPGSNIATYTLTVSATSFQTAVKTGITVAVAVTETENFALVPAGAGNTGSLNGTITGTNNQPVANAQVVLVSGGGGGGATRDTVQTNAQGYYVFTGLTAGNYTVAITATGYLASNGNFVTITAGETAAHDYQLTGSTAIFANRASNRAFAGHWEAGRLVLELGTSNHARAVEIFGANGALLRRIGVASGAARLVLPADITPASAALLRLRILE